METGAHPGAEPVGEITFNNNNFDVENQRERRADVLRREVRGIN